MSDRKPTVGVVVFPGSNCDHDAYHVCKHVLGVNARFIWHKETALGDVDGVLLPGGFAYGDYLRAGAIAANSPVMKAVKEFAAGGGPVLGICNGFQVLTESGMLPGALMRNRRLKFLHQEVHLQVANRGTRFTSRCPDRPLRMPISHAEGNYFADEETLGRLEENGQIVFRYCDSRGETTEEANVNGSAHSVAGLMNEAGNVLGMMPHPDRCAEEVLGNADGRRLFDSIVHAWQQARRNRI